MNFFAYKNRWGRVVVAPHDMAEIIEALKSPSIIGVIRLIESEDPYQAETAAKKRFLEHNYEKTFAADTIAETPLNP